MVVNTIVCGGGIVLLYISLWYVSKKLDYQVAAVAVEFGSLFLLELVSIFLAVGLPMLMAIFYDAGNRTMTYFTNSWLVVGLFIIPSVIGLVLPLTLYLVINRSVSYKSVKLSDSLANPCPACRIRYHTAIVCKWPTTPIVYSLLCCALF